MPGASGLPTVGPRKIIWVGGVSLNPRGWAAEMGQKADRDEVKRVIAAIVQVNGGRLESKTALFKAFYAAHIVYWRRSEGLLSTWPMARMPEGPGIDDHKALLREMEGDGWLRIEKRLDGPHWEHIFVSTRKVAVAPEEEEAIKAGLAWLDGRKGKAASLWSKEVGRIWHHRENGDLLDIYIDALDEDEITETEQRLEETRHLIDEFFP